MIRRIAPTLTLNPFQNIPNLPQNLQSNVCSTPTKRSSFREGDPGFSISKHRSAFGCTNLRFGQHWDDLHYTVKAAQAIPKKFIDNNSVLGMEPGSNYGEIWPPSCWCKSSRMMIFQVGTEKKYGQMYPMSRAYRTQGEPLFTELRSLFAPDDGPDNDPEDDEELIIIVGSDDEDVPPIPFQIMHALPALDQADLQLPIQPDSPVPELIVISSDESNHNYHDYFNSDVDIDFSDDEHQFPPLLEDDTIGEILNPDPMYSSDSSKDSLALPTSTIPIPAESLFAI
ncbi:hypothetical protein ACS0TY_027669 [Phlomoides rotata]